MQSRVATRTSRMMTVRGHTSCPALAMIRSKCVRRFALHRVAMGTVSFAFGFANSKASARITRNSGLMGTTVRHGLHHDARSSSPAPFGPPFSQLMAPHVNPPTGSPWRPS